MSSYDKQRRKLFPIICKAIEKAYNEYGLGLDEELAKCEAMHVFKDIMDELEYDNKLLYDEGQAWQREAKKQKSMLLDAIDTFRNLCCIEAFVDYEDTRKHYFVSLDDVERIHDELKKKYMEEKK